MNNLNETFGGSGVFKDESYLLSFTETGRPGQYSITESLKLL